jgi:hypothetical protein
MNADRREGKTEGSPTQRSLRKIADANDKVVDAAGHGGLRGFANRTVTCAVNAAQSIVPDAQLKKIYCKASAYR